MLLAKGLRSASVRPVPDVETRAIGHAAQCRAKTSGRNRTCDLLKSDIPPWLAERVSDAYARFRVEFPSAIFHFPLQALGIATWQAERLGNRHGLHAHGDGVRLSA